MKEHEVQERIQQAVRDSLTGLDELPSQEHEILEKVKREADPVITVYNRDGETMMKPAFPSGEQPRLRRLRPALVLCAAFILLAGLWMMIQNRNMSYQITQPDPATQLIDNGTDDLTPASTGLPTPLPMTVSTQQKQGNQAPPLDRVDLYVEPDLLWNEETGILAEGTEIRKSQIPFENAVYRKMIGQSVEGKMTYSSGSTGELLAESPVTVQLGGDSYSMDMPQKSLLIRVKDGLIDTPLFEDRPYNVYLSVLLQNGGKDCLLTRVADGVQSRLIEKYTDLNILTLAWKPVVVYLNDEYWGQCNMRESMDADTIFQYEKPAGSNSVSTMKGLGSKGNMEYLELVNRLQKSDPANNPEDREYLEKNVDIDSYLNWLAIEMYFGNADAASTFFTYQIYGQKWKCALLDMDYGLFNASFNALESYLKPEGFGTTKQNNTIFLKILEIDEYRELFLEKLGKLYQSLTTEVMQRELDQCVAMLEPEMMKHFERWAPYNVPALNQEAPTTAEEAYEYWKGRIDRMRNGTMVKRPWYVYLQTQEYFGLSNEEMMKYFGMGEGE